MTTNPVCLRIDGARLAQALHEAVEKIESADGEMALDFSAVGRIDPRAVHVLEELACRAGDGGVRIELRGVNMDVYKVLKLLKLAERFSFVS